MNLNDIAEAIAEKETQLFDLVKERGSADDEVIALADEVHDLRRERLKLMGATAGWSQAEGDEPDKEGR